MAKALSVAGGLVLVGLGGWGAVAWWPALRGFLEALMVITAVFVGLTILVYGLSELSGPTTSPGAEPAAPTAPTETPGET